MTELLLAGGGALIGCLLAVLGAGGSILLLPLLVTGAGLAPRDAVPLSLMVVTLLALTNLWPVLRRRQVAIVPALLLGVPALAGAWVGGSLVKLEMIPPSIQLTVFAVAAVVAALLMLRHPSGAIAQVSSQESPARRRQLGLAGQGLLVGLLTGVAGVGGGFAIVPALVLLARLPMHLAAGTSLILIALNSLVALLALGHWPSEAITHVVPLLVGGAFGVVLGQALAPSLQERQLRRGFACLLVGSALLTGGEALRQPVKQTGHRLSLRRFLPCPRCRPHISVQPSGFAAGRTADHPPAAVIRDGGVDWSRTSPLLVGLEPQGRCTASSTG